MGKLQYKDFLWPRNPRVYREAYSREPRYVTENKVQVFSGMGQMGLVISGEGAFCGSDALARFRELADLFADGTAGYLIHPVLGSRYCYFTALELTQEPAAGYVGYRFTFTAAQSDGSVPK